MDQYLEILRQYEITATFPITARVLSGKTRIAERLSGQIEVIPHGYSHIDYTTLSDEEVLEHLKKASEEFRNRNIPSCGFRFPYLRYNAKCFAALMKTDFRWDSSQTVHWSVLKARSTKDGKWKNYEAMLRQYRCEDSTTFISLPRFEFNILEIPVSLPDDDLLERGGIKERDDAEAIWGEILRQTHLRGELFTLQLHPERIHIFKDPLMSILERSKGLSPGVWITSLGKIYEWWKEKGNFVVEVNGKSNGKYAVDVKCSPRATVLIRSEDVRGDVFCEGFSITDMRKFLIKSEKRPVIGVPKGSPVELIDFLKNEGFIFEISRDREEYSLYIDNFKTFSKKDEMEALKIIHNNHVPLVRFWRWPSKCKSCLSITGDIDVITLRDFLERFFI